MVTVAVAGGTGGFGKTIVQELIRQNKHKVIVLSRKATPMPDVQAPVLAVDYASPQSLAETLANEKVQVVISAIIMASEHSSQCQLNLIAAASQTKSVTHFMPSEYGVNYTPDMLTFHPAAQWWLSAVSALRASNMQFTRLIFGWLLDFLGSPHYPSNLSPFKFVLDFENKRAALPGDGENQVTFLHSRDVGLYVAALVDEVGEEGKEWPEMSAFAGDRMSWREALGLAESVTGAKWNVTYDSKEGLEKGEATVLGPAPPQYGLDEAGLKALVVEFALMTVQNITDVSDVGLRNAEYPDIKPLSVRDVVEAAWGEKKGVA